MNISSYFRMNNYRPRHQASATNPSPLNEILKFKKSYWFVPQKQSYFHLRCKKSYVIITLDKLTRTNVTKELTTTLLNYNIYSPSHNYCFTNATETGVFFLFIQ